MTNVLEAESIEIFREAVTGAVNPVMMYSIGKDSSVMLADREFVGEAGFLWRQARRIPFHQRIQCDTPVPNP